MRQTLEEHKEEVRSYWEDRPCGAKHARAAEGTPEFFAEVAAQRNALEPFIAEYADFDSTMGEHVLEIGVGLGSDFIRFVRAGAEGTGIDLTQRSIELVRRRLELEGLRAELRRADAENLPFPDGSFDLVYSWGVLHHTPDCDRAIAEIKRVLKPGGRLCVMVYARRSWVAFGLWARHALLKGQPWRSRNDVLGTCLESLGTSAYTPADLRRRFAAFDDVRIDQVGTKYDRRIAGPIAPATGRWLGWFLIVRGRARRV